MTKKSISFLYSLICIILISCDGAERCIEENDFGEFNTEAFYVTSAKNVCVWDKNTNNYSNKVSQCVSSERQEFTINTGQCTTTIQNVLCADIATCISNTNSNYYNCLTNKGATINSSCGTLNLSDYQIAYETCINSCISSCESANIESTSGFWTQSQETSSGANNSLSAGGNFIIQAVGTLVLTNSDNKQIDFTSNTNKLQFTPLNSTIPFILSTPEVFQLSGSWCLNGTKNTCNNYQNQMGYLGGGSDINVVVQNFLRRGVIILNTLPSGSSVDDNNNYIGPMLKPNFEYWSCEKPDTSSGINSIDTNDFYNCTTGYSINNGEQYDEKNNELYPIENTFKKNIGGFVVPKNIIEHITPEVPFKNTVCETNNNNERVCYTDNTKNTIITPLENIVATNNTNNTNTEITGNSYLLSSNTFEKQFLYPTKLALKIIGDINSMDGSCDVLVKAGNDSVGTVFTVDADNKWHILSDNYNNLITLNKDNYNTLMTTSSGDQSFNEENFYTISIENFEGATWTDETGKNIPCGEGMVAFFMPQNEILINKSGFVSFKNLFSPVLTCSSDADYTCISDNTNVKFTIINPMYNYKSSSQSTLLSKNFYEYIKNDNTTQPTFLEKQVNMGSNGWSDEFFVRKGQILRFDENTWYDIQPIVGGGYTIKNKVIKLGEDIFKNLSHGLALKIEERPAFFCDGFETEPISYYSTNSSTGLVETITENKNVIQCYDLEDYDGAFRNLRNTSNTTLQGTVQNYGKLTANDVVLGAKKLKSLSENGTYGNFSDIIYELDASNIYSSNSTLPISERKYLSFVTIDNNDFNFQNDSLNNNGNYSISISPTKYYSNGQQMSVALAEDSWNPNSNIEPIAWLVKYNDDMTSESYGELDESSAFEFDSNGRLVKKGTTNYQHTLVSTNGFPGLAGISTNEYSNLRFFFKIVDKNEMCNNSQGVKVSEVLCKCSNESDNLFRDCDFVSQCSGNNYIVQQQVDSCDTNLYSNNTGEYKIQIETSIPEEQSWLEKQFSNLLMDPVLEIFDGKTISLKVDDNGNKIACSEESTEATKCNIFYDYTITSFNLDVGSSCNKSQPYCYENCDLLTDAEYKTYCKKFNDGGGFVERFYNTIIQDKTYNNIIKTACALMFSFYGLYYLLGLADFNQEELIKKIIKIAFIYVMISDIGWSIYRETFVKFFKDGMDYITFSIVESFSDSADLRKAIARNDYSNKAYVFSNIDSTIKLIFSDNVSTKISSLFWSCWFVCQFKWAMIYVALYFFFISVITAMVLYSVSQVFVSFFLGFGPVFFVFLIFDKTKGMFDKWFSNLIGFSFEQIFILTTASLFNTLLYSIIKTIFNYRICFESIWSWTILGKEFTIIRGWRAHTDTLPGTFQILLIVLLAYLAKNFIKFMANLGSGIGGADMSSSDVGGGMVDSMLAITKPLKDTIKDYGGKFLKYVGRGVGYKTTEDVAKDNKTYSTIRKGRARNIKAAEKDTIEQFDNLYKDIDWRNDKEKLEEYNAKLKENFINRVEEDPELLNAMKEKGLDAETLFKTRDTELYRSASMAGLAWNYISHDLFSKNDSRYYLQDPNSATGSSTPTSGSSDTTDSGTTSNKPGTKSALDIANAISDMDENKPKETVEREDHYSEDTDSPEKKNGSGSTAEGDVEDISVPPKS